MYAPVVLIDGEVASTWRRVHRLNDYVSPELIDDPFGGEVPASLLKAPTVDAAAESNAVVIGFADSDSGAFVQLELSTPAVELAELADSLADSPGLPPTCARRIQNEEDERDHVGRRGSAAFTLSSVGRRIRSRVLSFLGG